jgi:hypothetical protein
MPNHNWLDSGIETVNVSELADGLHTAEAHIERVYTRRPRKEKIREGFLQLLEQKAGISKEAVLLQYVRDDLNTDEYYAVIICAGQFYPALPTSAVA